MRPLQFSHFTPDHLPSAARLLAARHVRDRARDPALPQRYEDGDACLELIEALLAKGLGVAAMERGRLSGYLLAEVPSSHESYRRGFIPLDGHAIADDRDGETYREMYSALAPLLLWRGIFDHQVSVQAVDAKTTDAWFSLGFGQWVHVAARGLEAVEGPERQLDIRLGGPEDISEIMRLFTGLAAYDTRSPIFVPNVYDKDAWRRDVEKQLPTPENAFWLAYRDGHAIGVMNLGPARQAGMFRPDGSAHLWEAFVEPGERATGIGTALLRRCVAWARENGYAGLTLDLRSFNLLGARFWQGHGFRPVATILQRRIDPRIAWADGTNE